MRWFIAAALLVAMVSCSMELSCQSKPCEKQWVMHYTPQNPEGTEQWICKE